MSPPGPRPGLTAPFRPLPPAPRVPPPFDFGRRPPRLGWRGARPRGGMRPPLGPWWPLLWLPPLTPLPAGGVRGEEAAALSGNPGLGARRAPARPAGGGRSRSLFLGHPGHPARVGAGRAGSLPACRASLASLLAVGHCLMLGSEAEAHSRAQLPHSAEAAEARRRFGLYRITQLVPVGEHRFLWTVGASGFSWTRVLLSLSTGKTGCL